MGAGKYGYYLSLLDVEKVKFFGDEYIAETIIYLANQDQKEMSYRYYVTDALHAIAGNTAGHQRTLMKTTFREMWEGSPDEKEQTMSPDEIIEKMKNEFRKRGGCKVSGRV